MTIWLGFLWAPLKTPRAETWHVSQAPLQNLRTESRDEKWQVAPATQQIKVILLKPKSMIFGQPVIPKDSKRLPDFECLDIGQRHKANREDHKTRVPIVEEVLVLGVERSLLHGKASEMGLAIQLQFFKCLLQPCTQVQVDLPRERGCGHCRSGTPTTLCPTSPKIPIALLRWSSMLFQELHAHPFPSISRESIIHTSKSCKDPHFGATNKVVAAVGDVPRPANSWACASTAAATSS